MGLQSRYTLQQKKIWLDIIRNERFDLIFFEKIKYNNSSTALYLFVSESPDSVSNATRLRQGSH